MRRTLTEGRLSGLVTGLGAATADAIYGFVAGFGLTAISSFLISQHTWLRLVGGIFLCYLGLTTFLAKLPQETLPIRGTGLARAYVSAFFLTLTNPMTILSFAAIFAGLGVGSVKREYSSAGILVLGVFMGSALWWWILSGGVSFLEKKFTPERLRWANRISGIFIAAFGVAALLSLRG